MKKNISGQRVGAQMVSATDGSAFTGSVTVAVCGDAGTQAAGSVSAGACVHEGNGYHTYAPAQAETNYDLIAFTFSGTGAVPATVQVYPLPPTGVLAPTVDGRTLDVTAGGEAGIDWANIGSPTTAVNLSGTNIDTDQVVASVTGAVGSVTGNVVGSVGSVATGGITAGSIAADAIGASELAADAVAEIQSGLATAANLATLTGYVDTEVAAIKAKTDNLPTDPADQSLLIAATDALLTAINALNNLSSVGAQAAAAAALADYDPPTRTEATADRDAVIAAIPTPLSAAGVRAAVGLGSANLDAQLDAIPTNAEMEARTLTPTQLAKLLKHLGGVLEGIAAAGGSTTAVPINTSTGINGGVPSAVSDFYNGAMLVWITGALAGQRTSVSDYDGATKTLTVIAMSSAPAAADQFILV